MNEYLSGSSLQEIRFTSADLADVQHIDHLLQSRDMCDTDIQRYFISSFFRIIDGLDDYSSAIAVPYNCGTFIKTRGNTLAGIDLALIENYYQGRDWEIPSSLYNRLVDRLDILVVSHGHWDHCWIELAEYMIHRKKPVLVPAGMLTDNGKSVPAGCIPIDDGGRFSFRDLEFNFAFSRHAYDNGRDIRLMTTTVFDGHNSYLHTSDADTTDPESFRWFNRYPVDVLLFKFGGVSPFVDDYSEFTNVVEMVNPRRLVVPFHINELGHKGTDACRTYSQAYAWLDMYKARGGLRDRKYTVLFGNRVVDMSGF